MCNGTTRVDFDNVRHKSDKTQWISQDNRINVLCLLVSSSCCLIFLSQGRTGYLTSGRRPEGLVWLWVHLGSSKRNNIKQEKYICFFRVIDPFDLGQPTLHRPPPTPLSINTRRKTCRINSIAVAMKTRITL